MFFTLKFLNGNFLKRNLPLTELSVSVGGLDQEIQKNQQIFMSQNYKTIPSSNEDDFKIKEPRAVRDCKTGYSTGVQR